MSVHRQPDAARPPGVTKKKLLGALLLAAGLFAIIFGVLFKAAEVPVYTAFGFAIAFVVLAGDTMYSRQAIEGRRALEVGLLAGWLMREKGYDARKAILQAALCYLLPVYMALAALARWQPGYDAWSAMALCLLAGQHVSGIVYALAAINLKDMAKSFARKISWKNPPDWAVWGLVALGVLAIVARAQGWI